MYDASLKHKWDTTNALAYAKREEVEQKSYDKGMIPLLEKSS